MASFRKWKSIVESHLLFEYNILAILHTFFPLHSISLRWWVGGWQQCTATCGSDGVRKRTVLCVRTVSGEERVLHPVECKHLLKPKPLVPCNRDVPCGQDWAVGNWEEVSLFHYFSFLSSPPVLQITILISLTLIPSFISEEIFHLCLFFLQCPVTCGGGVRSRTVTCALAPKKTCDLSTKPRSRSLCALQSCPNSSLRRRPGPPPKYRRIYPPKSHPTKHLGSPTWAPDTTTTAAPTVRKKTTTKETTTTLMPATTSLSMPETRIPEIIDTDDYEFNVIVRKNGSGNSLPTRSNLVKKDGKTDVGKKKVEDREEEEEGSTPNVVMYTPGYDYVVEDRAAEEEGGIIDLDFTTATSVKNPLKSTTPTPQITPTLQTDPPTMYITRAPTTTTYSTPHVSTETWAKTTHHFDPHTPPHINPYRPWTHNVPVTTPMYKSLSVPLKTGYRTTQAARKLFTTAASPQSTLKIVKVKKPAVTPKKNSSASQAKKPSSRSKGSRAKSQKQKNPMRSSASDQSNLMTSTPVSMDIFWVVGNWSEVCADILLSYSLKHHNNKFADLTQCLPFPKAYHYFLSFPFFPGMLWLLWNWKLWNVTSRDLKFVSQWTFCCLHFCHGSEVACGNW